MEAFPQLEIDTRLEQLLAQAATRDRAAIEKHLAATQIESPGNASLWRRLLLKLAELAPLPVRAAGPHAVQFFVADGKYRMQVFALDDSDSQSLVIYLPNVMDQAISENLLVKTGESYSPADAPEQLLQIQVMDVKFPLDPPDHMKHMLGWNRSALKLTLQDLNGEASQIGIAESLCTLAAKQWAQSAAGLEAVPQPL